MRIKKIKRKMKVSRRAGACQVSSPTSPISLAGVWVSLVVLEDWEDWEASTSLAFRIPLEEMV